MRKTDTWQDGSALDTIGEMDSADSCDSVVSFNSCFSDDSLEFLSAEEKACLMFLEETIQSLDTEDDSGLSNDEPDQIPARGNVATKAAHLTASMGVNKRPGRDTPRRHFEDPSPSGSPGKNENVNYMVPTPFILANGNSRVPNRPGLAASPTKKLSAMKMAPENIQPCSDVNVVVISPPHKTKSKKENLNNQKAQNGSCGGPLSYQGLLLRNNNAAEADSGSTPAIQTLLQKSKSVESVGTKTVPPPVAPKPKLKASRSQEGATDSNVPHARVLKAEKLMNPEKVRLEALCKLGLLKVEQVRTIPQSPAHNQATGEPYRPCDAPKPEKPMQNLQHQRSVSDVCADPPRPRPSNTTAMVKAATLKRIGPSGSDINDLNTVSLNQQSCSSTVETKKHRDIQSQSKLRKDHEASSSLSESQHVQGFNVPVHSIGKDRRDALRKLGLLKN
nr:specifically androgen-regulated gene protein [Misgurnus anguillicaudatus]XP_055041142.1 specifically androgen-regulated gene protein [Misgurnus anguillicaudatus]XP_055041144.1 specifically androgen-regulated gene protein [Misgurnus anguillicaudatus]XP_055041145.1 specifically androgen-regulated gene protein [Misgurnus anguillicaudatus]